MKLILFLLLSFPLFSQELIWEDQVSRMYKLTDKSDVEQFLDRKIEDTEEQSFNVKGCKVTIYKHPYFNYFIIQTCHPHSRYSSKETGSINSLVGCIKHITSGLDLTDDQITQMAKLWNGYPSHVKGISESTYKEIHKRFQHHRIIFEGDSVILLCPLDIPQWKFNYNKTYKL